MRNLIAAALCAACTLPTIATAEQPAPGVDRYTLPIQHYIPTGYEVKGCKFYRLEASRTVQLCDEHDMNEFMKAMRDPGHPRANPGGSATE